MSFWKKGYPAVFISSFYKNPHMHTADDALAHVNRPFYARAARDLVGLMVDLAHE